MHPGERYRGVGDKRVVLGGDAEHGTGEVHAAAHGDAGPGAHPGETPHLRREPLPRGPGVRGGDPRGVEGVVQHQPRGLLGAAALQLLSGSSRRRRVGPDGGGGGGAGAPPATATAGVAIESGRGGRPRRGTAYGCRWAGLGEICRIRSLAKFARRGSFCREPLKKFGFAIKHYSIIICYSIIKHYRVKTNAYGVLQPISLPTIYQTPSQHYADDDLSCWERVRFVLRSGWR